jgi:hypothetical protein
MERPITDDEFGDLLRSFRRIAFYFEAQETYALDYEAADLERFVAGSPTPPPGVRWWRPWLDQVAEQTRQGKRITRVRIISEPPTDYQRWGLWALPWHVRAGERISYIERSRAHKIGLPLLNDWWLLDDERLIILQYNDAGEITRKSLVDQGGIYTNYLIWRDLAVRNATPAEKIAAA